MLDLHSHLLPGLDDGASDLEQSLAMARVAVQDGIQGVVCTPHWVLGQYENERSRVLAAVKEFQARLDEHGIPLRLYPGAELRLDVSLLERLEGREVLTLNDTGRYVLLELPEDTLPRNLDDFFWDLHMRDMKPIISHPERNLAIQRDPPRLYEWVNMGILCQLTAASLLGRFGKEVQRFSVFLLEHRLVHCLVTDSHGIGRRTPRLSEACKVIKSMSGNRSDRILYENPERIVHGEPIAFEDPVPIPGRASRLSLWKRMLPPFLRAFVALIFLGSLSACNGGYGPAIQEIHPEEKVTVGWNSKTDRFELARRKTFSEPQKTEEAAETAEAGETTGAGKAGPGSQSAVHQIQVPEAAQNEEEKVIELQSRELSRREYILEKFKGKHVVFPRDLPPEGAEKPTYRIGPEDELHISVWQNPDLSVNALVQSDGKISLPLVGELDAAGLQVPELESLLQREYARYVEKPNVTVTVVAANSLKVFITGAVRISTFTAGNLPSGFPLRGDKRLLTALSQVEIQENADLSETYVIRGNTIIPLDLDRLLKDGDTSQNILLKPADTVVIPAQIKEVSVLGEVGKPGQLMLRRRTTLLGALAAAGGVNRQTAVLDMAYLARRGRILPVNFKRLVDEGDLNQNILVEDKDIISIPSSKQAIVYVLGEVKNPKVVHFTDTMDVLEAIDEAGDFLLSANRSQVVVVRGGLHSPKVYAVDALQMMRGETGERFVLNRNDIVYVPRSPIGDWNAFVTQVLPTALTIYYIKSTAD
jgi:protein-tyrosine phosphatase